MLQLSLETGKITNPFGVGVNGQVYAMTSFNNILYVGGSFTQANGLPAGNVAAWNTLTGVWSYLGNGVFGTVNALVQNNASVYVGGTITIVDGSLGVNNIARWDIVRRTWHTLGNNGTNGSVYALASSGNMIYVGGQFTRANYVPPSGGVLANNVASYNTTTNTWASLSQPQPFPFPAYNGVNDRVYCIIAREASPVIYISGRFTDTNPACAPCTCVAQWNTVTNTWTPLLTNISVANANPVIINTMTWINSFIYMGGNFTLIDSVISEYLIVYNTLTDTWVRFGNGASFSFNLPVTVLAHAGTTLVTGGAFITPNKYIVFFETCGASVAIGSGAGRIQQYNDSVAIGTDAGGITQGSNAVAIGTSAGLNAQSSGCVALGYGAGALTQNAYAVSIGYESGASMQGVNSIAIGYRAGNNTQGSNGIAMGYNTALFFGLRYWPL
jgi:hypothetical protein